MKKRNLVKKLRELEERVKELEARPIVYQPFILQPTIQPQPWPNYQPYIGDPIPYGQPTWITIQPPYTTVIDASKIETTGSIVSVFGHTAVLKS